MVTRKSKAFKISKMKLLILLFISLIFSVEKYVLIQQISFLEEFRPGYDTIF